MTLRHAKVRAAPCMTGGVCRRARSWGFLPVGPGIAGQGQRNPRYAVLPYGAGAGAPTRRAVLAQQFDEGDDQRCLGQLRSEHSFGHPRSTLARSALVAKSAKSGFVRWWLRTPWTVPAVRPYWPSPGCERVQFVNRKPKTAISAVIRRARVPRRTCPSTFRPSRRATTTSSFRSCSASFSPWAVTV